MSIIEEILPAFSPQLFPHIEGANWVLRDEYENPRVNDIKEEIKCIRDEADKQVVALNKEIEEVRERERYLYELIRGTGYSLVLAVKEAMEILGFKTVIDADREDAEGESGTKHEDLRIEDITPVLLVEVKGISGIPNDEASLQVWKYIAPRMRAWGRTDITGLSIINHQRNIPALERNNDKPFRDELLTNAKEHQFGLLTTWDLYRLVRSFIANGWKHEYVRDLLYQSGRISPVPKHYKFLGHIEEIWERAEAVGIKIEDNE